MDLDSAVKIAAEKLAKKQAKMETTDDGEVLQPVQEAPVVAAPKTEHTLESLFKPSGDN